MNVVIIGGGLCGLTLALACASKGICTHVLERAPGPLRGGGALGIDRDSLMRAVGSGRGGEVNVASFPVVTQHRKAVAWQAVYRWLYDQARQNPKIRWTGGMEISEVIDGKNTVTAIATQGERITAGLIVGADGYRSTVRRAIDPAHAEASYAGYLLWRGLVPEAALPADTLLTATDDGVSLINQAGHRLIAYPVAGDNHSLKIGERLISFAWYDAERTDLLQKLRCLSEAGSVIKSLAAAEITPELTNNLRDLACRIWPDPWRSAILHALAHQGLFATPIAEYCPQRLHRGRMAIVGDAAHTISPVTGEGFVAGVLDAEALATCLAEASNGDLAPALASYENERLPPAQTLVAASVAWSRAFVRDPIAASRQLARRNKRLE